MSRTTVAMNDAVQYSGAGFRSILFVIGMPHLYGAIQGTSGPIAGLRDRVFRLPNVLLRAIARKALKVLF